MRRYAPGRAPGVVGDIAGNVDVQEHGCGPLLGRSPESAVRRRGVDVGARSRETRDERHFPFHVTPSEVQLGSGANPDDVEIDAKDATVAFRREMEKVFAPKK